MNTRIKQLRLSLGLNQADFGARIGVTQGSVTNYESGTRVPLDAIITSICREFGVSETWLRTGEGDMYVPRTRLEEITQRVAELAGESPNPFREKLILALLRIPSEKWPLIEQAAREILSEDPPETEKGREP